MFPSTDGQMICTYKQTRTPLKQSVAMRDASEAEQVPLRDRAVQSEPLTTSSSAALRPKEHVRCVRQLTKDEKSSRGMAVRTLRGNTVIRLLTMLEIPTASESSISILQPKA